MKTQEQQAICECLEELAWKPGKVRNVLLGISTGRANTVEELTEEERNQLVDFLKVQTEIVRQRRDRLRKALLAQGYSIGWKMHKTIAWCETHGTGKKKFNVYTEAELMKMVKILERIQVRYSIGKEMNYHQMNLN